MSAEHMMDAARYAIHCTGIWRKEFEPDWIWRRRCARHKRLTHSRHTAFENICMKGLKICSKLMGFLSYPLK